MKGPQPGYFAVRMDRYLSQWDGTGRFRQTPWTPALIYSPCPAVLPDEMDWPYHPEWWFEPLDRSAYPLAGRIGDRDGGTLMARFIWERGRPIERHAYEYLMARRAWCQRWAPTAYEARPIDMKFVKAMEEWWDS